MYTYPDTSMRQGSQIGSQNAPWFTGRTAPSGSNLHAWDSHQGNNKVGYKTSSPVLLNPPAGQGINLPDRGIVFFNLALLEKYIINKKTKNFKLPSLSSLQTGNISLTGIKLHQSGNILNEVRKNTQHSTIGHFKSYPFNHHFPLFNRRAIVGHKFTFSFNVQ